MFHALESAERLNMAERSQLFLTLIHFKQQKNQPNPFCRMQTYSRCIAVFDLEVSGKLVVVEGQKGILWGVDEFGWSQNLTPDYRSQLHWVGCLRCGEDGL